ncbi:DivIVA domain-containing protein [Lactobacillus sp. PV037]|uniref:DivIVA domain-containing protein n=1 Tax=unclassified Lactobacillus TaxID=2620435 RepID=UPI00223ED55B|nr:MULTISPECIES: DivIVA domain-containing protein [unclassified Lactobacillus]QNQ82297.1 DivIVA domain-containing protein [Lactobacillus sp. PV012]QNQ83591.1 DivIVA domain-containing protein [Lactobacillus sp. PV037]
MADLQDIKLSADDILQKRFKSKVKGYDQTEVDSYLDTIIADYTNFIQIINEYQTKIQELNTKLQQKQEAETDSRRFPNAKSVEEDDVKMYYPSSEGNKSVPPITDYKYGSNEITTNVAMIQRISTLERKVFNLEQRLDKQGL